MKVIYGIINKINGHKYIGSAVNFYKRKSVHLNRLKNNTHHSKHLQKAWNKYGESFFDFIILEYVENKNDLIIKEQWWLDNSNCEYNICKHAGNSLGVKKSKKTRNLISLLLKGRISDKQIAAQKRRRKPVNQYDLDGNFIKSWDSTLDAGLFLNKNHKSIISAASGKSNISYGFRWAYNGNELKDIKRKNHKFIYQYNLNGDFIKKWYTIQMASNQLKIGQSGIVECARGRLKTSGGFIWKYK